MGTNDRNTPSSSKPDRERIEAEQFRLLVENVQDYAIILLDPEGLIVSWNRGAQRIDGYAAGEVLGKEFSILYTEEDRRRGHPEWELRIAAEQGRYAEDGLRVRKDGTTFPAHVTITARRDEAGRLVGFAKVTRDITEERHATRMLESEREARQRATRILESITDAFFSLDREWHFTYINREAERLLRRSRGELLGKILWDEFPELAGTNFGTEYRRSMAERVAASIEGFYAPLEGWFEARVFPSPEGISVYVRDITERKRTEQRYRLLAEAGAEFAASLDYRKTLAGMARLMVPDLADLCLVDLIEEDDRIHRVAAVHRDPASEPPMWTARQLELPPQSPFSGALRSGEPVLINDVTEREIDKIARSDEHKRAIHALGIRSVMIVPLVARGHTIGSITCATTVEYGRRYGPQDLALARELAGRAALAVDNARLYHNAEEARGEAERRAREEAALRQAATAVSAFFTEEEVIRQIAQSALAATNADGSFVVRIDIGRNELVVVAVAGLGTPEIGARLPYPGSYTELVVERGESEVVPNISAQQRPAPRGLVRSCPNCSGIIVPLLDSGEPIGSLTLIRRPEKHTFRPDEMERARTFADLAALAFRKVHLLRDSEERREELENVMESRSRLMRGFSHDVKNPLGAADGFLQLLEEGIMGPTTERQAESVQKARRALHSALHLIEDLLELARAEAGEIEFEYAPMSARDAAKEMAEEYRAQAEAKEITFDVALPQKFPITESDSARVRQILGNLISNAVKYTPRGGCIRVSAGIRESAAAPGPGRWVAVDVADTGRGVSEEEQKVLFQEFKRLESAMGEKGAGIGLAISQKIARVLGGDITVQSELGKGSTFTLWLPLSG